MLTALSALSVGATQRGGTQGQSGPLTHDPRDRDGTVVSARQSASDPVRQAERSGAVATFSAAALQALQDSEALQPEEDRKTKESSAPASDASASQSGPQGEATTAQSSGLEASAEETGSPSEEEDPDQDGLTEEEEDQVEKLKQRDREVRAHEQAHARVGGPYAGAPSYTFQQGPDGGRYAIGGEVQIDTSPESEPEATVRKMQIVIRAALAPAEPSSQDLRVAQLARSQLQEAQSQARAEAAAELRGEEEEGEAAAQTSQTSATAPADKSEPSRSRQSSNEDNERSADAESRPTSDAAERRSKETASAYRQAADRLMEAGRLAAGTGIFA
jgi:hypothetical protein